MRVDPLVANYPIRIRSISIGIVLFITGVFYLSPRLAENTRNIEKYIPQDIESIIVPPTEQMQIEKPPARPSVPVASEDEFLDDDITIEETDLDDLEDLDLEDLEDLDLDEELKKLEEELNQADDKEAENGDKNSEDEK